MEMHLGRKASLQTEAQSAALARCNTKRYLKGAKVGGRQSTFLGLTTFGAGQPMMACEPPSASVCEEVRIWRPSRQDVKKEMPPGSRNDQRCTNSFSYKMEVCRSQGRDESLQAHVTIASGKSFHHELLWAGLLG